MKQHIYILMLATFVLVGCSSYQKTLKSPDPDYKYEEALKYFNDKEYVKAQTLLDDVTSYYKGTDRAQDVIAYLARSYMGQKRYLSAANYYESYIRNYPKGRYIIEARYQVAHCYYLDSPDARLDQMETMRAINYFNEFVELYPESPYAEKAYDEMNEMYDKLAYKEYLNAKLYYNLGTYLGNNYLSAEITARNALKQYPSNKYQEELAWIIFMSKYQQMMYSVEEKKADRARETEDEYYNFKTDYPESKHLSQLERCYKDIKKANQ